MRGSLVLGLSAAALLIGMSAAPTLAQQETEPAGVRGLNDSILTADIYTTGATGTVSTTFDDPTPADEDFFRFVIGSTSLVTIDLIGQDNPATTTFPLLFDPALYLYDGAGTLIAFNDDIDTTNGDLNSRLNVTLSPGTYFAVAAASPAGLGGPLGNPGNGTDVGDYRLTITSQPVPGEVIPEPGTCALLVSGALPLIGLIRRRARR